MKLRTFRNSRTAAAITILTLASFVVTLLPPRTSHADASDPIVAGTGGPPDLGMAPPTPDSPEAESSVNLPTGTAAAAYRFRLNRARGSAQPSLGLRYTSSNSVGFAGVGWTLDLPSIVRRGHSGIPRFLDPQFAGFTDPSTDDYMIDGSLLVPIAVLNSDGSVKSGTVQSGEKFPALPTNGQSVTWIYFRREVDDGRRYFFDGFTWYVQTKEGNVLQFGVPADQAIGHPATFAGPSLEMADETTVQALLGANTELNSIFRWNLVRETDATGNNTVYYVWDDEHALYGANAKTAGTMFLTDVYDTLQPGQRVQASSFAHHVHLTWSLTYPAGSIAVPYSMTPIWRAPPFAQLSTVQAFSATSMSTSRQLVREYGMTYVMNDVGTRSFLHQIQMTGDCDGETGNAGLAEGSSTAPCTTQLPTTFTYTAQPTTTAPTVLKKTLNVFAAGVDQGGTTAIAAGFADVDGDGRADYTYTTNTASRQIKVQLSGTLPPTVFAYSEAADLSTPGLRPILGDWASSASTIDAKPRITALVGSPNQSNMVFASGSLGTGSTFVWQSAAGAGPDVTRSSIPVPVAQSSTLALTNQTLSANPFDIDGDGLPDHWWQPAPPSGPWVVSFSSRDRSGVTAPFAQQATTGALLSAYDPKSAIYSPTLGAPPNGGFAATRAITDMDGDGIADIAIANYNPLISTGVVDVFALPGHGDGRFGLWNGPTPAVTPSIHVGSSFIVSPFEAGPNDIAFGDLNGDGFADYAVLTTSGLVICRRINGSWDSAAYQCMTDADSTFAATASARIAIADIDGSGIGQIIYNPNDGITSMTGLAISPNFMTGGVRNGLLQTMTNGLGVTTTYAYVLQTGMPVPAWVVQSVTSDNGLSSVDATQSIAATTSYNYGNQPIYDPRDRQFVGFRSVTQFTTGPGGAINASAPGAQVQTTFATDTCASYLGTSNLSGTATLCLVGAADYSLFRAIRGLPAVVEHSSTTSTAKYTTEVYDYTYQKPYVGLDGGRHVIGIASKRTHKYLWDTGQAGTSLTADVVDAKNGFPSIVANFGGSPCRAGSSGCPMPSNPTIGVPQNGSVLVTQDSFDSFGNLMTALDLGRPGTGGDTPLETALTPQALPDTTLWNWRVTAQRTGYATGITSNIYGPITGANFAGGQVVREHDYAYDGAGNLTKVTGNLSGTRVLTGPGGAARIAAPPQEGTLGTGAAVKVTLEGYTYDAFGNVTGTLDNRNPCKSLIVYDSTYQQLPTSISANPNVAATCPISPTGGGILTTTVNYDRRLERLTLSISPAGGKTVVKYDDFGRQAEIDAPHPKTAMMSLVASRTDYQDTTPIRRVHTVTADPNSADTNPTLVVDHYRYLDGFGQQRAAIDHVDTRARGTDWVLSGVRESFATGQVSASIKASSTSDPSSLPSGTLPALPRSPASTIAYDGLERVVTTTDFNGQASTNTYNTPLLYVDHRDAEQVSGSHTGSYKRIARDGHGRVTSTDHHLVVGPTGKTGDNTYSYTYLATGEITSIAEVATNTPNLPSRSMTYDSLGRMVTNTDPNSGTRTYAYNVDGPLVATSDARGCGENIYYDGVGRIVARDYLPCVAAGDGTLGIYNGTCTQAAYTSPALDPTGMPTGDGTEAFYVYDSSGRIQTKYDRARKDTYQFDLRDRLVSQTTMLASVYQAFALPAALANRYIPPSTTESFTHGATNRVLSTALPVPSNASGPWASPTETDSYTYGGRLASIGSSFGNVLTGAFYNPSGTINNRAFGDVSSISESYGYDGNDSLTSYTLSRPTTGPWTTVSPTAPDSTTLEQSLSALSITPDKVGNPTLVTDGANDWPSGAQAVSQFKLTYYDDYRLATTTKPTTNQDAFVSPYQYEQSQGSVLYPSANVPSTSKRFQNETFAYTDRGNATKTTDDATDEPDRSLGVVVTSATSDELVSGPNGMTAAYDAAGEMSSLNYGTSKYSYKYCWDETGRLSFAGRYNPSGGLDINYGENVYDDRGVRVFKTTNDFGAQGGTHFWLHLFDDVVVKHPVILGYGTPSAIWQYDASQAQFYIAKGLAHVFIDGFAAMPMVNKNPSHMFLNFRDRKGSTAFVVDHDTGEVVERTAYQPYGAPDADFRPARWQSFREDFKYDGHWDDAEIGLVDFGGRFYSPQLGRFVSPDPMALHGPAGGAVMDALVRREIGSLSGRSAGSFAPLSQWGSRTRLSPLNDGTAFADSRIDLATAYGYCSGNPQTCRDGNGLWNMTAGVGGGADVGGQSVQGGVGVWIGSGGAGGYATGGVGASAGAAAGVAVQVGAGSAPSPQGPTIEVHGNATVASIAVDLAAPDDVADTVSISPDSAAGVSVGLTTNYTLTFNVLDLLDVLNPPGIGTEPPDAGLPQGPDASVPQPEQPDTQEPEPAAPDESDNSCNCSQGTSQDDSNANGGEQTNQGNDSSSGGGDSSSGGMSSGGGGDMSSMSSGEGD